MDKTTRRRERLAALTGLIVCTIAVPVAIDQGYFKHNPYILPTAGLLIAVFYLALFLTSETAVVFGVGVKRGIGKRHPMLATAAVVGIGAVLGGGLAWAWWIGLEKSKEHLARLAGEGAPATVETVPKVEHPKPPTSSPSAVIHAELSEENAPGQVLRRLTTALHKQPHFRFVLKLARFGTETCDALELWNDGEPIELPDVRQASYIELSFAREPSTPTDDALFASRLKARYGAPAQFFGSVPEETINLNYLQELMRHPSNPMRIANNTRAALSLEDEFDVKYVFGAWDLMMSKMKPLGIVRKTNHSAVTEMQIETPPEQAPMYQYVRYIPTYYFHRRDYEQQKQPGKLVTLYAWQDGNPGTNYAREFARLARETYERFGGGKATLARRTFVTISYSDSNGQSAKVTYDVHPRDKWGAMAARRTTAPLNLAMAWDIDMKRLAGQSLLTFCTVPPALRSLEPAGEEKRLP